ncbi:MAG: hypothetical protein FIA99_20165 [Ruminiclostridium sp.]|nr:hypothetical protein [Ruminiclostridium sp.]
MSKKIYLSVIMHANMLYDRFGKDEILDKFPKMYRYIVESIQKYPEIRVGFELSGVTVLLLKKHAPDILEGLKDIVKAKRGVFLGTYFSDPLNMCTDEYFNYWNAWLGTEIIRRELGEPSGFYPQENSYHPGMPAILNKLGLKWMTVPSIPNKKPAYVKGLDSGTIVGVPCEVADYDKFERFYEEYPDNSIIVPIIDSEYHPNFDKIIKKLAEMKEAGKEIEWMGIPDYLKAFKPEGEYFYPPMTSVDLFYSRWITSPENIRVHEATMEAVKLYHDAVKLKEMIKGEYEHDIDIPYKDSTVIEEKNIITAEIESLSCLPDIDREYLSKDGTVSTLTRAFYLLLWAMNSDARGWFPLVQKTRERMDSFLAASALCRDVIDRGLHYVKHQKGYSDSDVMLVYNPHMKEGFDVCIKTGKALEFDNINKSDAMNLKSQAGVETIVRFQGDAKPFGFLKYRHSDIYDRFRWEDGRSVENASSGLSLQDYSLEYKFNNTHMTVYLNMPAFIETKNGTVEMDFIKYPGFKPVFVQAGHKLYPCMRIGRKLNESIYVTENYTLKDDCLECEWEFYFPRDIILGNLTWETNAIEAVIRGKFNKTYYNIPGGIIEHNSEDGRMAALNFAIATGDGNGVSVVSLTGSQCFRFDRNTGELALSLGASTLGPSSVPAHMGVDPECTNGSGIYQFEKFGFVTFKGAYRHRFAIIPFTGKREDCGIDRRAELCNKNVYIY